jgi:hypothetical protein
MTRPDDSALELLEHDLRRLAEPRPEDERLRLAVREQLAAQTVPRPRRRLSIRVAVGSGAALAATAAAALIALVGNAGSGGPAIADAAIIHHALIAVTPPAHSILHVKVVGEQSGMRIGGETWQETSPPYASRGMKGEVGHQGEFSENGTMSFEYDPQTNTIYEQPSGPPARFTSPIAAIRQQLAHGQAHYDGTAVINGVPLYRIELPRGLVGYFGQRDYQPRYLDDPQGDGSVVRLRVAAYGYLPLTRANRALLSVVAEHPGARVVRGPGPGTGK